MALATMPAVDVNICADWTEQQHDLYERLPYYLGKIQVETRKTYSTFQKLVKKRKWTANQGDTLRGVRVVSSPNVRQFFNPRPMSTLPLTDVMDVREVKTEAQVRHHDFESPVFSFYPSFADFMNHIDDNGKDIAQKIERAHELFIRGSAFHMAPYVFVCNEDAQGNISVERVTAPAWDGQGIFDPAVDGKITAFLTANLPTAPLRMAAIEQILTQAEVDLRLPFFKGSDASKDDAPLDGKFLIIQDSESYNQYMHDPFVKEHKSIDLNLLNNGFRGSLFGRATTRLEDMPIRYTSAGVFHPPEVRLSGSDTPIDDTVPNPSYTNHELSDIGVAWLCGQGAYESIEVGPPPSEFTSNQFPNAPKLDWNGKPRLTKDFFVTCLDGNGDPMLSANTYGRYLKFIATATFGILPVQPKNCIPILYKRTRGPKFIEAPAP
jgi:hypothetical protein